MMNTRLLLALALLLSSTQLQAWGRDGHAVVAEIAADHLSPAARAEVQRLLSQDQRESLVSIASWADEHRNPISGRWHYVNFERGSDMRYTTALCPGGNACLVEAIQRQEAILANRHARPEDRELALKYVVHLVGDAHQPLHAGYGDDKGGNTYQIRWDGRGSNLHHLWDTGMIQTFDLDTRALANQIETDVTDVGNGGDVVDWVDESAAIVASPGFYPPRKVPSAYVETWRPVVERRLMQAGLRLAAALNRLLG